MAKSQIEIVPLKRTGGPVTIEVTSGYSTIGSFVLAHSKKKVYKFTEFGKDPKIIDDNIPDIFPIPLDNLELKDYRVVILGKYRPAPGHEQILVKYSFYQDNQLKHESQIEKSSDEEFERFTNRFEFREE